MSGRGFDIDITVLSGVFNGDFGQSVIALWGGLFSEQVDFSVCSHFCQ